MHRDNVPSLPEGFELLGSTDKCPVHGMVRYVDGTSPSETSFDKISIITLQGELSPGLAGKSPRQSGTRGARCH